MLISAWYEDGKLILPREIKLKHRKMKVMVDLPEDEVVADGPDKSSEAAEATRAGDAVLAEAGITDPGLKKLIADLREIRQWKGPWLGNKSDDDLLAEGIAMKYGKES